MRVSWPWCVYNKSNVIFIAVRLMYADEFVGWGQSVRLSVLTLQHELELVPVFNFYVQWKYIVKPCQISVAEKLWHLTYGHLNCQNSPSSNQRWAGNRNTRNKKVLCEITIYAYNIDTIWPWHIIVYKPNNFLHLLAQLSCS